MESITRFDGVMSAITMLRQLAGTRLLQRTPWAGRDLTDGIAKTIRVTFDCLPRFGKTRIVACYTLPASVTIDKDIGKPRLSRRPAILTVYTDAADIGLVLQLPSRASCAMCQWAQQQTRRKQFSWDTSSVDEQTQLCQPLFDDKNGQTLADLGQQWAQDRSLTLENK